MRDTLVKDIMTANVITVGEFDTLLTVSQIFEEKKIHHIPVIGNDKLIGIISSADFERSKVGKSMFVNNTIDEQNKNVLSVTLVGMVMTKQVDTIAATDTLLDAYKVFKEKTFRSLPVVENDKLVGMLTPMDFLDFYFQKTN